MAQVHHGDLAQILKAFRDRRDETLAQVETDFAKQAKQADPGSSLPNLSAAKLESTDDSGIDLSPSDLERIADAYGIPRLMLDPLLSRRIDVPCLIQQRAEFTPVGTHPGAKLFGEHADYLRPRDRLRGTVEVAVVLLTIKPGGRSDTHDHPGDELMIVLDGEVEIRLENSGLWTRLHKHDYIHFYAEQTHSAWNVSTSDVTVLVVRFYQLYSAGTRGELTRELRAKRLKSKVSARVRDEMIEALAPFSPPRPTTGPAPVRDKYGLARLLSRLAGEASGGGRLSLQKLLARATGGGYNYNRTLLYRLQNGEAGATEDDLRPLARIFGTEPLILYPMLFPAVRPAVAVRQDSDLRKVPDEVVGHAGVSYWAPVRRLTDSDMTVAVVELEPGAATPTNRHPGQEIVVPLSGAAEVAFGSTVTPIVAGRDVFAHYPSGNEHRVTNPGGRTARLFVIRFYGD